MEEKLNQADSLALAKFIIKVLDSMKASDINLIHVEEQTTVSDYYVICTGKSRVQVAALAEEVEDKLKEQGITPIHTEGRNSGTWVLKDYGNVILHVFNKQTREYYNIERMFSEEFQVDISDMINPD